MNSNSSGQNSNNENSGNNNASSNNNNQRSFAFGRSSSNGNNRPLNNNTMNSTGRIPFVYTPMNRPASSNSEMLQNNQPAAILSNNMNGTFNGGRINNPINTPKFQNLGNNASEIMNVLDNIVPTDLNNLSNLNNISNLSNLSQEIENVKILISKTLQNQNEMQGKIIEYNKIINEQENIIRLNNLKLNEHDNKLTEILLSFNNYLQLNEKTSSVVSDVQRKMETFVSQSDFTDLKSTMYSLNKASEQRYNDIKRDTDNLAVKMSEIENESVNYQKYSLEKLSAIQKESMDSRLQQQTELIKMEESKENRINTQISQIKNLINLNDNNLKQETNFRVKMINDLRDEIFESINSKDEKIKNLEKVQIETEKNLIGINKDYVGTLNELINKNNEKFEIG